MIGETVSHFTVVSKLGEGGMGVVYRAEDNRLGRPVALKFLASRLTGDSEARERFFREARAAALLNHPNVCTVYEIDESRGRTFIAMALLDGQTCEEKARAGPVPLDEALDIAGQVAQGLKAAHAGGVVHRDLKPANVMITNSGLAAIMDFGLAELAGSSGLTQSESILGTPAYMAPEQLQGSSVDARADIWALGALLYELIAGRPPFQAEYHQALVYSILNEAPQPLTSVRSGVPLEVERIVSKCLAKDPGRRYQHVDDLLVDLEAVSPGGAPNRSLHASQASPATSEDNRRRFSFAAIAVLLAAAGFAAMGTLRDARSTVTSPVPVRRFSITTKVAATQPKVSPDGRFVVYVSGAGDESHLVLHDLVEDASRRVRGTERARLPFWAPDSKALAFASGRELRRVTLPEGAPRTLCTFEDVFWGGAWSPDGETVIYAVKGVGIFEVPSRGGVPRLFIPDRHVESPNFWVLGDGSPALVFAGFQRSHVVYMRVESTAETFLLSRARHGFPAPFVHGPHVFFVSRNGEIPGIFALKLPVHQGEEAGEPFLVTDRGFYPSVANDGSLVYLDETRSAEDAEEGEEQDPSARVTSAAARSDADLETPGQLVWRSLDGSLLGKVGPPLPGMRNPFLSPDGSRIIVRLRSDLWVVDVQTQRWTKLSSGLSNVMAPRWSASGAEVFFSSDSADAWSIYRMPLAGGGPLPWPVEGRDPICLDWSPDGKTMLFRVRSDSDQSDIDLWTLTLREQGGFDAAPFLQTTFRERLARFAPDGAHVAYVSDKTGREEVYVRSFPDDGQEWRISMTGGNHPKWSPAGDRLFYANESTIYAAEIELHPAFTVRALTPLFRDERYRALGELYDVGRDGSRVLMVSRVEIGAPSVIRVIQNWSADFAQANQSDSWWRRLVQWE